MGISIARLRSEFLETSKFVSPSPLLCQTFLISAAHAVILAGFPGEAHIMGEHRRGAIREKNEKTEGKQERLEDQFFLQKGGVIVFEKDGQMSYITS